MEQYILKSALIAEIEKLKEEIESQDYAAYTESYIVGVKHTLETISDILNTLEVKEVDLEKEMESWRHNHFHGRRDKEASGEYLERVSQLDIAKHFFELGLSVSNKAQKGEKV